VLDISQCTISAFQKHNSIFEGQICNPISNSTSTTTVDEKKNALECFTFTFLKYFPYLWTLQLNNHLRANEGALVSIVMLM
jgi:hypothetical protein